MMTHPLPIAGKLPIKTLVVRQLPTNIYIHVHTYIYKWKKISIDITRVGLASARPSDINTMGSHNGPRTASSGKAGTGCRYKYRHCPVFHSYISAVASRNRYCKSGNFRCKNIFSRWRLRKLILRKLAHTINVNAVRGRSYENFLHKNLSYESFFIRKFPDLQYMVNMHMMAKVGPGRCYKC